jgi:hypothetical protein
MGAWPVSPGIKVMGHVTASGWWHPGAMDTCTKGTCADDAES